MSFVKLHVQAAVAAFQFLTRIPVPVEVPFERPVLTRSIVYFPLAGAAIGLCLSAASWALPHVLPPWPSAVVLLAIWIGLSGGLHLDGWMDTADGVLSHRSRDRMLEIMKDSRVGAMGVIAAVLLLLLKASLIAWLIGEGLSKSYIAIPAVLLVSAVWSRAWMGIAIAGWKPARPNEGIGQLFHGVKLGYALVSAGLALFISFATLIINEVNLLEAALLAVSAGCVAFVTGGLMALWLNRKLGGLTGDTYGAMNEAVELAMLMAVVIWAYMS
ncbi:adenosylcobinamide-GDP ribazoletransferase [Paenibacillus pinisoli]|uniref:Adenosylcobinamide-GDP ribazoletransferase n=1 Tax=Paenibacillus pinisoli TaxID=1276110 RepID=A0A3A6PHM6_9BACL|nr:adenosylcobinamide-GDP ribazoletransferase [Paenibacillus pinisoli]RJX40677.1 adenosylcobinamide-GDP ribazoletransferase [Paenibacillus pinisoli]